MNTRKQSLLDQAKAYTNRDKPHLDISDEVVELVLAWLKGEIKDISLRNVLQQTQAYPTIARALRRAYQQGKLKITQRYEK
jgi:hypothetical protein